MNTQEVLFRAFHRASSRRAVKRGHPPGGLLQSPATRPLVLGVVLIIAGCSNGGGGRIAGDDDDDFDPIAFTADDLSDNDVFAAVFSVDYEVDQIEPYSMDLIEDVFRNKEDLDRSIVRFESDIGGTVLRDSVEYMSENIRFSVADSDLFYMQVSVGSGYLLKYYDSHGNLQSAGNRQWSDWIDVQYHPDDGLIGGDEDWMIADGVGLETRVIGLYGYGSKLMTCANMDLEVKNRGLHIMHLSWFLLVDMVECNLE